MSAQANSAVLAKRDAATAAPNRPDGLYARSDEVMPALVDTLGGFLRDRDIGAIVLAGSERPLAARDDINEAESLSRIDLCSPSFDHPTGG
jgi:enoyl-CoA hydratase